MRSSTSSHPFLLISATLALCLTLTLSLPLHVSGDCVYSKPSGAAGANCASGQSYVSGSTCGAICLDGYTHVGGSITCVGSSWDSSESCTRQATYCTGYSIGNIAHAADAICYPSDHVASGDTCVHSCQTDWYVNTFTTCDCSGGTCSFNYGSCYYDPPSPCTYVKDPLFASSTCNDKTSYEPGYGCSATCYTPGYVVTPTAAPYCIDGYWSSTQTCVGAPCTGYVLPGNATTSNCTSLPSIPHNQECVAQCATGFYSAGHTSCSYNVLTSQQVCLPQKCYYNQTLLANTVPNSSNCSENVLYGYGQQCTTQCAEGFTAVGRATCTNGTFTGFSCQPNQCLNYQPPLNYSSSGCVKGNNYTSGTTCGTLTCQTDYQSVGPSTLCYAGKWTMPKCSYKPCSNYQPPSNSISSTCLTSSSADNGASCVATCKNGYTSTGITSCNVTIWNYNQTCTPTPCLNYKLPKNAITSNCTVGMTYKSGSNCTAVCRNKAQWNNLTDSCSFGQWNYSQICTMPHVITDIKFLARNASGDVLSQQNLIYYLTPSAFLANTRSYQLNIPFPVAQFQFEPHFSDWLTSVEMTWKDVIDSLQSHNQLLQLSSITSEYTSPWMSLNPGGGRFEFNLTTDIDGTYSFVLIQPPQYLLQVAKQPKELYINTKSSLFSIETVNVLQEYVYPVSVDVVCLPSVNCEVVSSASSSPPARLTLTSNTSDSTSNHSFSVIVRGLSSGNITISLFPLDRDHILPLNVTLPIKPQANMLVSGSTTIYSFTENVFLISPSATPIETFTVTWMIDGVSSGSSSSNSTGQLILDGNVVDQVNQTFYQDANPAVELPLPLTFRAPSFDVPSSTIRLVGIVNTLSGSSGSSAQFSNSLITLSLHGVKKFTACGTSKTVYVSGTTDAGMTGSYQVREPKNDKPHFVKVNESDSTGRTNSHLYYYFNIKTQVGSWILEQVDVIGSSPSASALYNNDDSAPFSAAWRQLTSNIVVGTLTIICGVDCAQVGTPDSIESSVCTGSSSSCSLSCAKYLPAVTSSCAANTFPANITSRITALTQSCSVCSFDYVSSVLQTCGATLTSSDLTSDLSEVVTFPTVINPLSGASHFVCPSECSTSYLTFYSRCLSTRSTVIPYTLHQFYGACLPSQPPLSIDRITFLSVTSTSITIQWNVPKQLQEVPLPLTYKLEQAFGMNSIFNTIYSGSTATIPAYISNRLIPNTLYRYRISAITSAGSSQVSAVFSQTTANNAPLPPATFNVTATPILVPTQTSQLSSTFSITLQWSVPKVVVANSTTNGTVANSTGSSNSSSSFNTTTPSIVYTYLVTILDTTKLPYLPPSVQIYYGSSNTTTYSSFTPGTNYNISISVRESVADPVTGVISYSSWSVPNVIRITTPITIPSIPTLPFVRLVTKGNTTQIDISWANVGCGAVNCTKNQAFYEVQMYSMSVSSPAVPPFAPVGTPIPFPMFDGSLATITATAIVPSTTPVTIYSFRVRAYNTAGSSATSSIASVTTAGVVPTVVPTPTYTVADATGTKLQFSFVAPLDSSLLQFKFSFTSTVTQAFDVYIYAMDLSLVSTPSSKAITVLPTVFQASVNYTISLSVRNQYGWSNPLLTNSRTTFKLPTTPPKLVSCVASDMTIVSGSIAIFNTTTIITLTFDRPTNAPYQVNTSTFLDTFLQFTPAIGTKFNGTWLTSSILKLRVVSLDTSKPVPVIGVTQCQLISALYTSDMSSSSSLTLPLDSIRVPMSGAFGLITSTTPSTPNSTVTSPIHLIPTTTVLVVDQDGTPMLLSPAVTTSTDAITGTVTITATAIYGGFITPTTTSPQVNFTTTTTYVKLQELNSPLATLRYVPPSHFVGTDLITITLNGTLGIETWTRVVSVKKANHPTNITVPVQPINYTIDTTPISSAVGIKLTGIILQDEDSSSTSFIEIEFTQPLSLAARFKYVTALPALCQANVANNVWTSVLNLRGPYAVLTAYITAGNIIFTDTMIDTDSTSIIAIHIRVDDHGSDVVNGVAKTSETIYYIRPLCSVTTPAPTLTKAQISTDLSTVLLSFDAPIGTTSTAITCPALVDTATLALLGDASSTVCSITSQQTISITLGVNSKFQIGSNVTLNSVPASAFIKRCSISTVTAKGTVTVLAPDAVLPKPKISLIGPSTIGACESLVLDTRIEGTIGTIAPTYVWTSTDSSLLPLTVSRLSTFTIPSILINSNVDYVFTVRVINSVGISSESASLAVRKSSATVPSLIPVSLPSITLSVDHTLDLLAIADISQCLAVSLIDQALGFAWTVSTTGGATLPTIVTNLISSASYPKLSLPTNSLTIGAQYTFTLTATQKVQPSLTNSLKFIVNVVSASDTSIVNNGGSTSTSGSATDLPQSTIVTATQVGETRTVIVSIPSTVTSINVGPFVWTCRLTDGSICINGITQLPLPSFPPTTDGTLTIPAGTLIAPNSYVLTATTTLNPTAPLTVTTITVIHPTTSTQQAIFPQIVLKASSLVLDLSDSLFITSTLLSNENTLITPSSSYSYVWSSSSAASFHGISSPSLLTPTTSDLGSSLSLTPNNLAVSADRNIWQAGSRMKIRLTITDSVTGQSTFSELSVSIVNPPHSGTFIVSPTTGQALNTSYSFTAQGWIGTGTLTYQYSYSAIDGSQIHIGSHTGAPNDVAEFMFPGSENTGYYVTITLLVTDSLGYQTKQIQSIRILPNPVLMTNPIALNNWLNDHVTTLTNTGGLDSLIALVNGQSAYNSADQSNSRCAEVQTPYKLTWSPVPSTGSSNGNSASSVSSTKLLIDSLTSILTADPTAASSLAVITACKTLLNDMATMTSITLSDSLRTTCSLAVDPTSGASSSSTALASQFATTIALLNINRRNTDINNGGAYTYNTVSASNRRRLLDVATTGTITNTTAQSALLAASTRTLITSLSLILDRFTLSILAVPGQLITLPDCQMPSAVRRDLPSTPIQYIFDLDNTTVTYASNWMAGTSQSNVPIDTRMTYSTANLYSFASNWMTDHLKPLSGMILTSRTTISAQPIVTTHSNPSMWITIPFNTTACVGASTIAVCTPQCMTYNDGLSIWSTNGVSTQYPSKRNIAGTDAMKFADCIISTASTTVALFTSMTAVVVSSSTGATGPTTDAQHANPYEFSTLGEMPDNSQLPSSTKTSGWAITATMFLYLDSSFISAWLKGQLVKDLSSALGITASRITVDKLTAGSILATFTITPDLSPDAPTPTSAYSSLRSQLISFIGTGTSNKLSSGALTRFSEDLRAASYVAARLCGDGTFQVDSCDAHGGYAKEEGSAVGGENGGGGDDDGINGGNNSASGLAIYIIVIIAVIGALALGALIFLAYRFHSSRSQSKRKETIEKMNKDGLSSMPAADASIDPLDKNIKWSSTSPLALLSGAPASASSGSSIGQSSFLLLNSNNNSIVPSSSISSGSPPVSSLPPPLPLSRPSEVSVDASDIQLLGDTISSSPALSPSHHPQHHPTPSMSSMTLTGKKVPPPLPSVSSSPPHASHMPSESIDVSDVQLLSQAHHHSTPSMNGMTPTAKKLPPPLPPMMSIVTEP